MPFQDVSCIKNILTHVNNKESLISVKRNDTRTLHLRDPPLGKKQSYDERKRIKIPYIKAATIQIVHAGRSKLKLCKRQKSEINERDL